MTSPRQSRVTFALLFLVTLLTAMGNLGLVSVMPAIGRGLAIPDALIASTFSLSALAWALTSQFWARKADNLGRKPILLLGLLGFSISMGGCALVVHASAALALAPLAIFAAFIIVRSTYGLLGSAAPTAAQALIADSLSGAERVKALSYIGGALSLGTILGPAVAPFLIFQPFDLAGPPLVFAMAGLALILMVAFLLPGDLPMVSQSGQHKADSIWRHPKVRPILVHGLIIASAQAINLYILGFALIDAIASIHGNVTVWIGFTMSAGALSSLIGQFFVVPLLNPAPHSMLKWGALIAVLGNLVIVVLAGPYALAAGFVIASFGYGLARPGMAAAASSEVGPELQGAVAGAVSAIAGASIALPPVIASIVYQYAPAGPFLMAAAGAAWVAVRAVTPGRMFLQGD